MNNISNKQTWIIITCISFFATFLYVDFVFSKNNYLNERIKDLKVNYNSFIKYEKSLVDIYSESILDNPKVSKLLYDAMKNPKNSDEYRADLFNSFSNEFEVLKSKGFNVLHFHDFKGSSFLRFHKPKKYGDSLIEFRSSILKVKNTKEVIYGVETGRSAQVFRVIYPIFYEKEYVGSFEISSSLIRLINELNSKVGNHSTFLSKSKFLEKILSENDLKNQYITSWFKDYYIQKGFRQTDLSDEDLKNFISIIEHKLDTNLDFALPIYSTLFSSNIYTFISIKNIEGDFIGYLVSKDNGKELNDLIVNQLVKLLFVLIFVYIGLILYTRLQKRNDENKKIFNQYQNIIDKSVIVSKTDPNGIITYVNEQFTKVSGYSKEELIGNSHNIVRHPDTKSSFFSQMWKRLLSKKTWQGVIKNRSKNGEDYYVKSTIAPILNEKNEIVEFIALREDITNLVNKKNEFKLEKEKMKSLFDHIDEILIIKKEDKFEQISQKFFEVFPYENLREFTHQHKYLSELFIEKEGYLNPNSVTWIKEVMNNPNKIHKVLMRDKEDNLRTFCVKIQKVPFEKTFYYLFMFNDITFFKEENNLQIEVKKEEKTLASTLDENNQEFFKRTIDSLKLPESIVFSLIDKFIESTEQSIEKLDNSIENRESKNAKIFAHNIKGSAGTLKFDDIFDVAKEIEDNIEIDVSSQINNVAKLKELIKEIKSNRNLHD